jgi:hypothetical protein
MTDYLREQSVGDVLRNAFVIYRKGFGVILLTFVLPVFPFLVLQIVPETARDNALYSVGFLVSLALSFFALGAITIAVSDICLGNRPSVTRSYKKLFGSVVGKLFAASWLQTLVIEIGCLLLCVPGVIWALWLLFTSPAVVLEGLGPWKAFQRSRDIARGYNWRNLGVLLLIIVLLAVVFVIIGVPCHLLLPQSIGDLGVRLFIVIFESIATPLIFIVVVLLYYDLRVRKEAYDAAALAEDLRR